MNINLLKSFVVLAEQLHFGEAAQRLNLSQPALTKQIRRLEEDLGAPLFERGHQSNGLTPVGRYFLDQVRPLLIQAEEVWDRGCRAARGQVGKLLVGFSYSTIDVIAAAMPQFRRQYPGVEIDLHDLSSADQMERLLNGTLQVGFVRLPARPRLACRQILTDRLALVVPRNMADRVRSFDVEALRDLPFVLLHRDRAPGLHDHVMQFCASRRFQPRTVHYANESLILLSLVAAEVGVALIHQSALTGVPEGVVVHAIDDPAVRWDVGIAWAEGAIDPLTMNFIELVAPRPGSAAPARIKV